MRKKKNDTLPFLTMEVMSTEVNKVWQGIERYYETGDGKVLLPYCENQEQYIANLAYLKKIKQSTLQQFIFAKAIWNEYMFNYAIQPPCMEDVEFIRNHLRDVSLKDPIFQKLQN